ncbi:MAG: type I 3-dehydroquinate dehydratase [Bacteroidota bacterium]
MICVSIGDPSQIAPTVAMGTRLLELRLDLLRSRPEELFPVIPEGIETVVTCRPGSYNDQERIVLLSDAIALGATYVDLELESPDEFTGPLLEAADRHGCKVIISHHDFEETPGRKILGNKLEQCFERGGAIAKIATQVHSKEDVINLLSLYSLPGRKVVLGMGADGRITRVVGPYLGAEFTFASPGEGNETAPGQLDAEQLIAIYKVIDAS